MAREYREGAHTVYDIKMHLVWVTKYRHKVLRGEVEPRTRDLIRQVCAATELKILEGHVGVDHVHLLVSMPPSLSQMMQYVKGKSSRVTLQDFAELKRCYWGSHLWARGYFCALSGTATD